MKELDQNENNCFPTDITLKAVYRNSGFITESVKVCLSEKFLTYEISEALSGGGKFISFTISTNFETEDILNETCSSLKSIDGFMMMF